MSLKNIKSLLASGAITLFIICITVAQGFAQDSFSCTEVIGFSQSWQWFTGKPMSEAFNNVSVSNDAFLSKWQGRFEFGAAVELWKNREFKGWKGTFLSKQMCPRDEVDRVIFNISGAPREIQQWAQDILRVVEIIDEKYPNVNEIVLQPVVGAVEGQCRNVRAAQIHPMITKAIDMAVAKSKNKKVKAGATPKVKDCNHYADRLGHLSSEGALYVRMLLLDYYSSL